MSATPAGWYPDPGTPGQQRYWDGGAWTDHTAPLVTQSSAAPAYPQTPAYQPAAPPAIPAGHELAGWWSRVGGAVLDSLIVFAIILGPAVAASILTADSSADTQDLTVGLVSIVGSLVGYLIYAAPLMRRKGARNGQTWGKQAAGIRVIREDSQPVTYGLAVGRELGVKGVLFGFIGGLVLIPPLLNVLWPLWDERNQALHDKLCSTFVVKA